ncbi:MAG: molybdopterin-binding/glycosyltransferase family 2 protein [Deltaproteobacteria bacterium]|jgi:molybdenum cofactor cytidylyltransferase|nr:molybdopterin-binding/glycosyltransferase family 2 protein [Deltaproteobacteria bacterium]MBW2222833.1 molybdopterin-binding/glycosyltransferase family 2 protein [Deltaproteobacteria bacterium]MBW2402873.1 molybdopterin-binding/glycosyltransferase family 2 protein [Deltaproteobacteria bacterium]
MKFDEVDIDTDGLEGAILAHTLRLGNGAGAVKKGSVLTANDIKRLRKAGYRQVMVAQLERNDVHEDRAAARLAAQFIGPGVTASEASTGRCNLHATALGLLRVDPDRIDAGNGISESITIATLPAYSLVPPNAMIATVKVITFAVSETDLEACTEVFSGEPALRIAALESFDAGLVLTELPGVSQSLLERASRAQRARLSALGSRVRREVRCEHSTDAVARAIDTLREEGCDPILLLGASAIVDRGDVIPSGLKKAGGEVVHLGMPVDPGNLLMVGTLGESTVFGLPGCARSLNPSGFDHVLRRFFIGEPIDSALISGLGVGGLLKEIPDRPMPRNLSSPKGARKDIVAVVLAAGVSRRMGQTNKLTIPVDGTPMVARVVDALRESGVEKIFVVTGHAAEEIRDALGERDVEMVHNPNYEEGMGTSVRTGVSAVGDDVDGVLVALADMPWVSSAVIDRLLDAFSPDGDLSIYIPMFGRKRGNPVLWGSRHFPELRQLSGDVGGKSLFHRHAEAICYVDVESAAVNIDIDTPKALHDLGIDGSDD